jgi:hypothetical protein
MNPTKTGLYSTYADDRSVLLYWDGEDWVDQDGIRPCYKKVQWTGKPLFVPALRTWVGLDEDEIRELYGKDLNYRDGNYVRYAKSVEAQLKERNGY